MRKQSAIQIVIFDATGLFHFYLSYLKISILTDIINPNKEGMDEGHQYTMASRVCRGDEFRIAEKPW